ncbi:hypothetical protein PPSIR1_27488 [Plesiocystis pacifica SIR-1]|uniref:Uncharacterized protein n=1 Tax=Plesiocystis pacifica SIR-1 TaxID=391625 RepID=A6G4R2_9BACT|nr:hypothetical protein PPSIR1_27488 [Plesiocystis pacifica SIR-1]
MSDRTSFQSTSCASPRAVSPARRSVTTRSATPRLREGSWGPADSPELREHAVARRGLRGERLGQLDGLDDATVHDREDAGDGDPLRHRPLGLQR